MNKTVLIIIVIVITVLILSYFVYMERRLKRLQSEGQQKSTQEISMRQLGELFTSSHTGTSNNA